MQKFLKNYATPTFLLGIKFFTAFRTGLDTLIVAGAFAPSVTTIAFMNAVLYVLLIDAVMTGLWLYAAYGGDSQRAQLLKVFAIFGAWVLYVGMIIIGWEAHPEAPFLALMGRIAGAIALGYDTWDTISGPVRSGVVSTGRWIRQQFRGPTPDDAYRKMVDRSILNAFRSNRKEVNNLVRGLVVTRLEAELPDVVATVLPLPSVVTGNPEADTEDYRVDTKQRAAAAVMKAWEMCRENLDPGQEFKRTDIEKCTTLARSQAGAVINYAIGIGEAAWAGHGLYVYQPESVVPVVISSPSGNEPSVVVEPNKKPDF